jgi:hypothetical protein
MMKDLRTLVGGLEFQIPLETVEEVVIDVGAPTVALGLDGEKCGVWCRDLV